MALQLGGAATVTNVTVPTTTEAVIVTSEAVKMVRRHARYLIMGWAQLTSGSGTTDVTARIRRGDSTGDPLVGEANAEAIKTAAGSTEPFSIMTIDEVSDRFEVVYSLTLQQAAATTDGTALQAAILVLELY